MGKMNKSVRFVGEVIALTTEKSIKGCSKIINKTLGKNERIENKLDKMYKLGDDLSDKIIRDTKQMANWCDKAVSQSFEKKTIIYGDARYIYEDEKIIDSKFEVEE